MDFHTLSRKDLQTLCKKNKIPANITNVAMADSLAALDNVDGLEEFMNSKEVDVGTPNVRTAVKASTQRKTAREEAEGSKVPVPVSVSKRPQRGARAAEGVVEQENKDANVILTPAPIGSRRRATAVSTRRKKEVEMVEDDADKNGVQEKPSAVPKTPAAAPVSRRATGRSVCTKNETPGGTSVQRVYSTRRSVRLLEKDLSKMSLVDTEDNGPVKKHDDVSQDLSNMSDSEKGSSLQAASTVASEDTVGMECQSHESGSDLKLVSVTEIDMVVESHGSDEAEPQKVKCLELDAEPHASNEEGSELLEESGDSSEVVTLLVVASEDAIPQVIGQDTADVTVVVLDVEVNDQVSNDVDDKEDNDQDVNDASDGLKELVDCNMDDQVIKEGVGKEGFKVESIGVSEDVVEPEKQLEAETEKIEDASDVTAEDNEDTSENLEAEAQAEESEEPVEAEDHMNSYENLEADVRAEESEEPAEDDLVKTDNAFSSDVVSADSAHEQKSTDLPVQSDVTNKENANSDELKNKSIAELRRMLKDLTLGGKSNRKTNDLKEVEKKRTALQLLPQNQITGDEAQIDI